MRRQLGVYFLALSFMLVFTAKVPATAPSFTTIDAPGAIYTEGVDINDFGLTVGRYYDGLPPALYRARLLTVTTMAICVTNRAVSLQLIFPTPTPTLSLSSPR